MKIIDFAVMFCFIFTGVSISIDISQRKIIQAENLKVNYNEVMFMATEDAAVALNEPVEEADFEEYAEGYSSKYKGTLNLDKALECFHKTFYLNMGVENNKVAQDEIRQHLPVKIVVANDGYYVNAIEEVFDLNGKKELCEIWLPKKPFSYFDKDSELVINFTLTDYVYIFDTKKGSYHQGKASEMVELYPKAKLFKDMDVLFDSLEFEKTNFDLTRKQTIIDMIRKDLELYTVRHNNIAKASGKSYSFNIPYITSDQWENTIKNTCFIAFLQGFPMGIEDYNTYGFGGSQIIETDLIYATGEAYKNGVYHLPGCAKVMISQIPEESNVTDSFYKKNEAASFGYHPCKICKP